MSGDHDQTDQVSHGCFLRHLPWARISGVYPIYAMYQMMFFLSCSSHWTLLDNDESSIKVWVLTVDN